MIWWSSYIWSGHALEMIDIQLPRRLLLRRTWLHFVLFSPDICWLQFFRPFESTLSKYYSMSKPGSLTSSLKLTCLVHTWTTIAMMFGARCSWPVQIQSPAMSKYHLYQCQWDVSVFCWWLRLNWGGVNWLGCISLTWIEQGWVLMYFIEYTTVFQYSWQEVLVVLEYGFKTCVSPADLAQNIPAVA